MCKQTESIAKLTEALVKVQSSMETASKDANNPFFKSKYTTLAGCWDVARKPLSDNGLAVIQTTTFGEGEGNSVIIETTLSHISGEWIRGSLKMPLTKLDPQAVGSAITYARRYALSAMIGIVSEEDDDGESAMGRGNTQPNTAQKAEPKQEVKAETPKDKLIKQAYGALMNGLGLKKEQMLSYIQGAIGRDDIHGWGDLTVDELNEVIAVAKKDAMEKKG